MAEELVVTTKPNLLRRRGIEAAVGTLAGLVLACVVGPQFVSLKYKPLGGSATIQCGDDVATALGELVQVQLLAGVIGGALLLLSSFFLRRAVRKRREARAVPSA